MMATRPGLAGALVILAVLSAVADIPAQEAKKRRDRHGGPPPGRILEERFNRFGPRVHDPLPDARGYDAAGDEFRLRSLKGHYTVLVFGCLT